MRSTIPIFTAAPTYVFSHTFSKKIFQNFLGPFPRSAGAQHPHFRIPLLALRNLGFFLASPPLFTPAAKRWSLTSNVTLHNNLHPIKSPALTTISTQLISYIYHGFNKALPFKNFLDPFAQPQGPKTTIFEFPPRATYPRIFSRISNPIYA